MENNCYKLYKITKKKYMFDVDATYILTLKNSTRKEQYLNQLKKYNISKVIYIQENKGYKLCKKKFCNKCPLINNANNDILHAYYNIFKHAKSNNYEKILTLEDDFFISKKINKKDLYSINNFIKKINKKNGILRLGTLPILSYTYLKNFKFRKLKMASAAHAMIFPNNIFSKIIESNKINKDPDLFFNTFKQYCYYKPLIYQLVEETESKKTWGGTNKFVKIFSPFFTNIVLHKCLKLNKNYEPGTSILYSFNVFMYEILPIFLIIYFMFKK